MSLSEQAYQLCRAIEAIPASEQATKASVLASNLWKAIKSHETKIIAAESILSQARRECMPDNLKEQS